MELAKGYRSKTRETTTTLLRRSSLAQRPSTLPARAQAADLQLSSSPDTPQKRARLTVFGFESPPGMATPPPSHHLASLLQGLSGETLSPGYPSPAPPAAPRNDVNDLLKMLGGGAGQAPPLRSPPPPQTVASSPLAPSNPGFNLLDFLNQSASGRPTSGALPSPGRSAYSGGQPETVASMRSDVSQAGSPGGSMGGTSLMEMLMGR